MRDWCLFETKSIVIVGGYWFCNKVIAGYPQVLHRNNLAYVDKNAKKFEIKFVFLGKMHQFCIPVVD